MNSGEYNHKAIEEKWQAFWAENETFKTESETSPKPKYYVLDMFPYPSGAGLHVGHPLGYIASDIVARYKRAQGFNVLHPMGFDSFGLPAEQYAIETGQHPALTTEKNIENYKRQLKKIGFSYDWSREVRTSDPEYYKWTQWIFILLFESWYNQKSDKAEPVSVLKAIFEKEGNRQVEAACDEEVPSFSAEDWNQWAENKKGEILLHYRLAYVADTFVNWCPALGTVLANDEVKDGFSERGGHPVERKKMRQWSLRITAYADRLLRGLDTLDWSDAVKEMQRNWIGKSQGASLWFDTEGFNEKIEVFTTRIDTVFGVTFLSLAPEHPLAEKITTPDRKAEVDAYQAASRLKSERDRMADVKTISGVFTGAYAIHPFNGEKIQIWIADYVLAGYGTGAVMAVPSSDTRDYAFARHFGLPVIQVQTGPKTDISKEDFDPKAGTMINSGFLNGLPVKEAIAKAVAHAEETGKGKGKINYRMRDAIFGRQRYWGEPVPVYFRDGVPKVLNDSELPLILPEIDEYKPTETGEPPLGRAKDWKYRGVFEYELSTMPGWAGSSWYFLRYMDPGNMGKPFSESAEKYWQSVDLYMGGTEHATGHLLYSRFWHKFLKDRGFVSTEEPFQKLVNQGMIQGISAKVTVSFLNISGNNNIRIIVPFQFQEFFPKELLQEFNYPIENLELTSENGKGIFVLDSKTHHENKQKYLFLKDVEFPTKENLSMAFSRLGKLSDFGISGGDVIDASNQISFSTLLSNFQGQQVFLKADPEKMSKSKYNVVNPDTICEQYGADTLRLYEMFLGPLEQSKPWNTNGIEGVYRFLRKLWNLFSVTGGRAVLSDAEPSKEEQKALHKVIKKTREDIENLSLNTSVSSFMVAVNELSALRCNKKSVLTGLLVVIAPYAPHICEELWEASGMKGSVSHAAFPDFDPAFLTDDEVEYPISVNGKVRAKLIVPADTPAADIETQALALESVQKWMEGKPARKVIVVPKKIVNVVI
jgi:leucyl-tRNA synthetase